MKRDQTISILKGIGILCVVIGHASIDQPQGYRFLYNVIYAFHMPLFLIASGYFFKAVNIDGCVNFIKRKLKGVYFPFLKWSLIFLLLHNFFFKIGVLNAQYGWNGNGTTFFDLRQILFNALNILLRMEHYDGYLLGAYWFMRVLFVSSILICVISSLINKLLKNKEYSIIATSALFLIFAIIKTYYQITLPVIPRGGYREVIGVSFIGVGYIFGQTDFKKHLNKIYTFVIALVLFLICIIYHPSSMAEEKTFIDSISMFVSGCCGFVLIYQVSLILKHNTLLSSTLSYMGGYSLTIMTFHFLMFKPISYLRTIVYGWDWHMIGCHPVINEQNTWMWICLYVVTSTILSLLLGYCLDRTKYLSVK